MDIHLENVGKKFSREWLFKNIRYTFGRGERYAVTGPNGSGKSTLIQLIAGNQLPSAGTIRYSRENKEIPPEDVFRHLGITAPYLELIEEFTLGEAIDFHFQFKHLRSGVSKEELVHIGLFENARHKFVKNFSSGMKQRLKLLLAFYSNTPVLLLDEPTTNLDKQGVDWYLAQVEQRRDATILVASNQPHEYSFCEHQFSLHEYKA